MKEFHQILQRMLKEHPNTAHLCSFISEVGTLYLSRTPEQEKNDDYHVMIGPRFLPIWNSKHQSDIQSGEIIHELADECGRFARAYQEAPLLKGDDQDGYRLLSEHGDILLAATLTGKGEYICATWQYSGQNKAHRESGNYFINDYRGACEDFTKRADMIPEHSQFPKAELAHIHSALRFTLENAVLDYECEREMEKIIKIIENGYPPVQIKEYVFQNRAETIDDGMIDMETQDENTTSSEGMELTI